VDVVNSHSTVATALPVPGDTAEARAHRLALLRALAVLIPDERVLEAMRRVPRHLFMAPCPLAEAYANAPVSIGHEQTISQPAVVGIMTAALELRGSERVLEIGAGSGYQAAILSLLASEVYTIERVPELAQQAVARLGRLGYANVRVRVGDGHAGWPERAPFDRVLLTAAPAEVPPALFDQLADGGILVAPVGRNDWTQQLYRYRKTPDGVVGEDLGPVRFVPMLPGG
jgi:protein-L-isoaspartate(D-aspartate) O-methyltransferase